MSAEGAQSCERARLGTEKSSPGPPSLLCDPRQVSFPLWAVVGYWTQTFPGGSRLHCGRQALGAIVEGFTACGPPQPPPLGWLQLGC